MKMNPSQATVTKGGNRAKDPKQPSLYDLLQLEEPEKKRQKLSTDSSSKKNME